MLASAKRAWPPRVMGAAAPASSRKRMATSLARVSVALIFTAIIVSESRQ